MSVESMTCSTLIYQTFLSSESIRLGRFVRNINEPQSDFLDPDCDLPSESVIVKPHLGYQELQQNAQKRSFATTLTSVVSASRTKRNNVYTQVTTDRVTTYQLGNSGSWFKAAVKMHATREWIKESLDQGEDIYVVVGYHTLLDAKIIEGAVELGESAAQLSLPVTAAIAGAGVIVPLGDIADPEIAADNSKTKSLQRRYVAIGEQVCAVQYRKVRFKWFSSRDLDAAALEKDTRWKVYWNVRGQEIGTNDVVEVDLQDELELESEHEKHIAEEDEEFLF